MRHEAPRYALVVWPDDSMGCVPLASLGDAVSRGAVVIAREWEPVATEDVEPAQSNPRRFADEGVDGA